MVCFSQIPANFILEVNFAWGSIEIQTRRSHFNLNYQGTAFNGITLGLLVGLFIWICVCPGHDLSVKDPLLCDVQDCYTMFGLLEWALEWNGDFNFSLILMLDMTIEDGITISLESRFLHLIEWQFCSYAGGMVISMKVEMNDIFGSKLINNIYGVKY